MHESFLKGGIVQQFLNQVHMTKQHSSTAVPLETQCIQSISEDRGGEMAMDEGMWEVEQ